MNPKFHLSICLFFLSVFLFSCNPGNKENKLFELVDPKESGIHFNNQLTENDSINVLEFMNIYTGGGVATGDINNDGLPDLYFSGNMVSSRLYLNKSKNGKLEFEDITTKAGVGSDFWATGVNMVDINQDGLMDLYVCVSGNQKVLDKKNKLYINNGIKDGIPTFREAASEFNLDDSTYTTQAAFLDYDNDGDLDVFFVVNYPQNFKSNSLNVPVVQNKGFDVNRSPRLFKNLTVEKQKREITTEKLFIDVSEEAGINDFGYGLGIAISDVNKDGWPDIYVACDFLSNDIFYINNQDGTFSNKIPDYFTYTSYAGMGVDIADINNDGYTDIAVVDMTPEENSRLKSMRQKPNYFRLMNEIQKGYYPQFSQNTLQLNNGSNLKGEITFSEISRFAGIHHTDWSWSALFADLDNDGFKDFFVSNGFRRDMQDLDFINYFYHSKDDKERLETIHSLPGVKMVNYVYQNQGNLQFKNKTEEWGLRETSYSNGAIYVDLDKDGDLDLVVNNIDDKAFLYKNTSSERKDRNHFIEINFAGPTNNKNGVGAKVEILTEDNFQLYENFPTKGFQSCVNTSIIAGLGKNKVAKEVRVTWPGGLQEVIKNIPADTSLLLHYKNANPPPTKKEKLWHSTIFKENNYLPYLDKEIDYNDFSDQLTLPFRLSQSGPGISVGDVNKDGLEDFFIGGSSHFPGSVFINDGKGAFSAKSIPSKIENEDLGSTLFDADGDGDLDLYVVSGSVEQPQNSIAYQDRLYFNDGKGNFTEAENALPSFLTSGSCVVAADFDKDGDLDLFIGGRVSPKSYPLPVSSKLLLNETIRKDEPVFIDATDQLIPSLNNIGMVTSALWTDMDNDSWLDLMIVGDGVPITFFKNNKGTFSSEAITIANSKGFWNSIVSADFDLDGNLDYIIGNLGQNSLLKASAEEPVNLYAKDIDANGKLDLLLFHYLNGKNVPFYTRDEMIEQVFIWRGHFPSYKDFASLTFQDFETRGILEKAYHIEYDNFSSCILKNKGNGEFELTALPLEVQISPVNGMLAGDFNKDDIPDLLMVGNSFSANLYVGWMGASVGNLLVGKGDGTFQPLSHQESGFFVNGSAKSMVELVSEDKINVLVSKTADSLKVFEYPIDGFFTVPLEPNDSFAEVIFKNGKKEKREFYYGSSYLSQNSRHIKISDKVHSVTIYDFQGNSREIRGPLLTEWGQH